MVGSVPPRRARPSLLIPGPVTLDCATLASSEGPPRAAGTRERVAHNVVDWPALLDKQGNT